VDEGVLAAISKKGKVNNKKTTASQEKRALLVRFILRFRDDFAIYSGQSQAVK
jgi:hypothetical protein